MDKFLKIIQWVLGACVNLFLLLGVLIVALWLIWDIKPQKSVTEAAYFLSESWAVITGQRAVGKKQIVRKEQLEDSAARTVEFDGKVK